MGRRKGEEERTLCRKWSGGAVGGNGRSFRLSLEVKIEGSMEPSFLGRGHIHRDFVVGASSSQWRIARSA